MPGRARQQLTVQSQPDEKWQRLEITMGPSRDIPILYANRVIVNFTGKEFLVSVLAAFPEPWTGGPKSHPPKAVEAKVLARYGFSVPDWVLASQSFAKQIERLRAEGALTLDTGEETE